MVEDYIKRNKFKRLINSRMPVLVQKIRLIGNLSDKRYYKYSKEEIDLIKKTINSEVKDVFSKFDKSITKDSGWKGIN